MFSGLNFWPLRHKRAFWTCTAPDIQYLELPWREKKQWKYPIWLEKEMSQFLFAVNCSRTQEFYSLIVLNVPCWLSQGLLQMLDPRAVWVYGLRCRRGGTPRYAKPSCFFQVFSSAVQDSVQCGLQACFYWYLCVETFLIITYINLRGAHIFCCRYRQTLRAIHWHKVLFRWSVDSSPPPQSRL